MKYFVVSDIHSHYDEMFYALSSAGFKMSNPDHIIISLGDLYDRGDDVADVTRFVLKLFKQNRIILIKGNHEDGLMDVLNKKDYDLTDIQNGTYDTIMQLASYEMDKPVNQIDFKQNFEMYVKIIRNDDEFMNMLSSMVDYYETENYIFVHGYIPVDYDNGMPEYMPDWRNAPEEEWVDARFYNGMELSCVYNIKPALGKTVIVGHENVMYGHIRQAHGFNMSNSEARRLKDFNNPKLLDIFYDKQIIALDASVYKTHRINVLELEIDL